MSIALRPTAGLPTRRPRAAVVLLSIIAGLGVIGMAGACRQEAPPAPPALRLSLDAPYSFGLALAPDGRRVAFPGPTDRGTELWLHDLTDDTRAPLEGTVDAAMPFWSPDGGAVAYFAGAKLRVFSFADRSVRDLADAPAPLGGAWHASGDIVFAPDDAGLKWRRANGSLEPFTTLDGSESSHRFPRVTADGRHVVFFVRASESTRQGISIVSVDQPSSRRRLINSDAEGVVVGETLFYSSGGALVAQRINPETLALEGRPVLMGAPVGRGAEHQLFATAAADVLIFGAPLSMLRELRWMDRAGAAAGVLGEPMEASDVRLAPRGAAVAVTRVDPQLNTFDIWAYEEQRPVPRRLSPNIDVDEAPAWSRDGTRLTWVSGRRVVTIRDARAALAETALRKFDNPVRVTDWSAGEQWIVITEARRDTRNDIVLMRGNGQGDVRDYATSSFNETQGAVSPDDRWLAYVSDESGRQEIYADTFPVPGHRARLTVGGGAEPRWSRDGRELFFRRGPEIHAVRLTVSGAALEATSSERLFSAGAEIRSFDVSPEGTRFLVNLPASDATPKPLSVVVNVRSLLR
jgi:Tol biopolymer transport system component